jgi:hypothetical protein
LDWRREIFSKFNGIFRGGSEGDSGAVDYDGLSKKEIIEIKRQEAVDKKFRWYNFIYQLADGDITKFDKILDLNLIFCFNHISYRKTYKV